MCSGRLRPAILLVTVAAIAAACSGGDRGEAAPPRLSVGDPVTVAAGGRDATVARDPATDVTYVAWGRPVSGAAPGRFEAVVARSGDGDTFEDPVVVSPPQANVTSAPLSAVEVAVGRRGEVYVLFADNVPVDLPDHDSGITSIWLVRSDDGRNFSAPTGVGTEAVEGTPTTTGMHDLFVASGGDVFVSYVDLREQLELALAKREGPVTDEFDPLPQLRVSRSTDGGRSFARSVLVAKPGCGGTRLTQPDTDAGTPAPLYLAHRSEAELPGSYDAVRDPVVSVSRDGGSVWGRPLVVHDDAFKVSACPEVSPGLAADAGGRLHAAWYTGSGVAPGIYYAASDDEGKAFSEPVTLLTDEWVPYGHVQLAVDEGNRPWVAFEDRRGEEPEIQVAHIGADGRLALSAAWPGRAPQLTAGDGGVVVTWTTGGDGEPGAVRLARVRASED
ncbi:MAG: sialidase family protein [Acidimicrobiia bacterium]